MYATEKYVKLEVKELKELINSLASDQGSEIQQLYQELMSQRDAVRLLQQQITELRDLIKVDNEL